jgi:hypothetical protein
MKIRNIFGNSYSGKLDKSLVAAKWKRIEYIRKWVSPTNPKTDLQVKQRQIFTNSVDSWHQFTRAQQSAYERIAEGISGFNEFVRTHIGYQREEREYLPPMEGDTLVVYIEGETETPIKNAELSITFARSDKVVYTGLTNEQGKSHYALVQELAPYDVKVTGRGFKDYQAKDQSPEQILTKLVLQKKLFG